MRASLVMGRSLLATMLVTALGVTGCEATRPSGKPPASATSNRVAAPTLPAALTTLLQRIPLIVSGENTTRPEEAVLAKEIQAFKSTAVLPLISLLDDDDPRIERFAGRVLEGIDGLTDEDLDALVAVHDRGDVWIVPAIARIGTPRAIQFLVDDLHAETFSTSQVMYALKLAGPNAAVAIARMFASAVPVSFSLEHTICDGLHSMANNADAAINALLAAATMPMDPVENRFAAVRTIGCIGPTARRAIPALNAIAASRPAFRDAVANATIAIGTAESVPFLVTALRDRPSITLLRDIAEKGPNVRDTGTAVAGMLRTPDRELRIGAARTLGFIGYDEDPTPLVSLLDDGDDWQLVYVTAESLGRIHATAALPALDKLAKTHWYPPVREGARRAAGVVRGTEQYPASQYHPNNFAFEYFAFQDVRGPLVVGPHSYALEPNALSPSALTALTYDVESDSGQIVKRSPTVGVRTPSGFLIGSDRGEWGGELVYIERTSAPKRLLQENIQGIHQLGTRTIVVTGLAHMMMDVGALYVATPGGPGGYQLARWKTLPGAPRSSGMLTDGSLAVSCGGGEIVVKPDGRIEMAAQSP